MPAFDACNFFIIVLPAFRTLVEMAFLAVLVLLATLLAGHCAVATTAIGMLNFWNETNFSGHNVLILRWMMGQWCYNEANLGKPLSIQWKNFPASGFYDGKSKIAFYSKKNCQGTVRTWFTTDEAFPANLALDGIDSGIKSFMLWQINDKARRIVTTNLTYTRSSD
jgi:hypothetical protein